MHLESYYKLLLFHRGEIVNMHLQKQLNFALTFIWFLVDFRRLLLFVICYVFTCYFFFAFIVEKHLPIIIAIALTDCGNTLSVGSILFLLP